MNVDRTHMRVLMNDFVRVALAGVEWSLVKSLTLVECLESADDMVVSENEVSMSEGVAVDSGLLHVDGDRNGEVASSNAEVRSVGLWLSCCNESRCIMIWSLSSSSSVFIVETGSRAGSPCIAILCASL